MEDMTETVQTRLAPRHKNMVTSAAARVGLTLAAYIRMAVLTQAARDLQALGSDPAPVQITRNDGTGGQGK